MTSPSLLQPLFLSTLLPCSGASTAGTFFVTAFPFPFAAATGFGAGFVTTVVAVEVFDAALTVLLWSFGTIAAVIDSTPFFARVIGAVFIFAAAVAGFLVALAAAAPRVRVALGFSCAWFAGAAFMVLVAAIAAALAGDAGFGPVGTVMLGLSGEVACERRLLWGEPSCGRVGLWWGARARELEDLGERTVAGFEGWWLLGFGRFLDCRGIVGSGVFSLSSSAEKWSLGRLVPCGRGGAVSVVGFLGGATVDFAIAGRSGASAFSASCFVSLFEVCFRVLSRYLSYSSPMFAVRIAVGTRLTRNSILARRLWACNAYCARSFRARSVTRLT